MRTYRVTLTSFDKAHLADSPPHIVESSIQYTDHGAIVTNTEVPVNYISPSVVPTRQGVIVVNSTPDPVIATNTGAIVQDEESIDSIELTAHGTTIITGNIPTNATFYKFTNIVTCDSGSLPEYITVQSWVFDWPRSTQEGFCVWRVTFSSDVNTKTGQDQNIRLYGGLIGTVCVYMLEPTLSKNVVLLYSDQIESFDSTNWEIIGTPEIITGDRYPILTPQQGTVIVPTQVVECSWTEGKLYVTFDQYISCRSGTISNFEVYSADGWYSVEVFQKYGDFSVFFNAAANATEWRITGDVNIPSEGGIWGERGYVYYPQNGDILPAY